MPAIRSLPLLPLSEHVCCYYAYPPCCHHTAENWLLSSHAMVCSPHMMSLSLLLHTGNLANAVALSQCCLDDVVLRS